MRSNPIRVAVTVLMDALFGWAAAIALSMVIRFFGALAANPAASAFMRFAERLVVPVDARVVATPYGGSFEVAAAYTVVILLAAEWLLSVVRRRVRVGGTTS
jgi:hypothetical protein